MMCLMLSFPSSKTESKGTEKLNCELEGICQVHYVLMHLVNNWGHEMNKNGLYNRASFFIELMAW